ncbi:MAG: DDE-type integrase/transposase/recombinase, partial [Actinobacteria bacterium]|nr:DDE-type integrase/transposase/recombinase [Actinomycetota bacterium]
HVCIDDATRVAYVEVLPDEKAITAIGFLRRALAFYRSLGVEVQRVMTDNGAPYASLAHAAACRALGLRHIQSSEQRRKALQTWVERYNERRPHGSLGGQAPMTRLRQSLNNVLVAHI